MKQTHYIYVDNSFARKVHASGISGKGLLEESGVLFLFCFVVVVVVVVFFFFGGGRCTCIVDLGVICVYNLQLNNRHENYLLFFDN